MKRRGFYFFISFLVLFPAISANAVILVPKTTIKIVKNTVGGDGVFSFAGTSVSGGSGLPASFEISTAGGTGLREFSVDAFNMVYEIEEIVPQGWQLNGIDCSVSGSNSKAYVDGNKVRITAGNYESVTCSFNNSQIPTKTPVLIIPGIMGTELYNGNDLIWPDLEQAFWDINDQFLTENLELDQQGNSINSIDSGKVIEKMPNIPLFNLNIFEGLRSLLELDDYTLNKSTFYFPYDWRLDLEETKSKLQQKIEAVKLQANSNKVDIIAHSMGGLLVKAYLNDYGKDNVRKLIFVGTPHLGAPKAGKTLLEGDRFSIPWLEEDRIKELALNMSSLHELLPNQTYFNEFQGYIKKYSLFGSQPLLDYSQTKDFFVNDKNKNSIMFQKAETFFNEGLQNFDFTGIDAYNISGCRTGTQAAYSLAIGNNSVGRTAYTSGDGTVPLVSADYVNILSQNKFYIKDASHSELPSMDGVRGLILGILQNNISNLATNVSTSSDFCQFKGKSLSWHSPVEVHIYDQSYRHTGPSENNSIEYGIPGVDYEISEHNKFIYLPTDENQQYQVAAKGLDSGSFDLGVSEIENEQYLDTQIFNDVPVGTTTTIDLNISGDSRDNQLELQNGNEDPVTVLASATLSGQEAWDLIPPQTQVNLSGTLGEDNWYTSEILIALQASDEDSGVLETRYSLDGDHNFGDYNQPLTLNTEGVHKLFYYSIDKAGNNEEIKSLEIKIDKTAPEFVAEFDLENRAFVFRPKDNLDPNAEFECFFKNCKAEDKAGNKTSLEFAEKKAKILHTLSLKKICYNGVCSDLPTNLLVVKFLEHKEQLRDFDQTAFIKNQEIVRINYHKNKDQSEIFDWSKGEGRNKYKTQGMKILQFLTNRTNLTTNIK